MSGLYTEPISQHARQFKLKPGHARGVPWIGINKRSAPLLIGSPDHLAASADIIENICPRLLHGRECVEYRYRYENTTNHCHHPCKCTALCHKQLQ